MVTDKRTGGKGRGEAHFDNKTRAAIARENTDSGDKNAAEVTRKAEEAKRGGQ